MSNTPTNKKNYQQNSSSPSKSRNVKNDLADPKIDYLPSSGSKGQKRHKISFTYNALANEEKQPSEVQSYSSKEEIENSSPINEKEEFDDKHEKSSSHYVCSSESHVKPIIKNAIIFEKFNSNEKKNKQIDGASPVERGIGNFENLASPAGNEEKKFKSNNSNLTASIVMREFEVQDKNGKSHQVSKKYMKVKIPKSPNANEGDNNNYNSNKNKYSTRGIGITPSDENNTPTSNRRKVWKKVPKNQENHNHTPNTVNGQSTFDPKRTKHRRNNNEYIPNDYNVNNDNVQYIELQIVPEDDSLMEDHYPAKPSKGSHKRQKTPRHIHKRHTRYSRKGERKKPHRRHSSRRGNYSAEYSEYDSYYESSDEEVYDEYYDNDNERPTKRKQKPRTPSEHNQENHESYAMKDENAPEFVQRQSPIPTPTPTTNSVGTDTKLIRNSSSTQTSFIPNNRADKLIETSSIAGVRNYNYNDDDNQEVNTNENVFNSPRNSTLNNRSSIPQDSQNPPELQSSPREINSPRSPRSPRSPSPTYKSGLEGLTNSIQKTRQLDSPIKTRSSVINKNSEEVPINRVPISSDDENENDQNESSISSLEDKIKQIGNRGQRPQSANRNANINELYNQQKNSSSISPKESGQKANFLSESNSESGQNHSDLFNKPLKENDESYEEVVLKPSQGSSVLYQPIINSKLSTQSNISLPRSSKEEEELNDVQNREIERRSEEDQARESSHMSPRSSHSKPASKTPTAENSSLKGRSSHHSSTFNLDVPSHSQHNSLTTESTKQPSLINEGSSKKGLLSKVSFNSNMSRSSNKPSNVSRSAISIESEVQDFITPDKKSTANSKKSNSVLSQHSNISKKSGHSNLGSSIHSNHDLREPSIHSKHSLNEPSVHSVHNSNGSNSYVSEGSLNNKSPSILSNSASTFVDDKPQNQFSAAFDNLSDFTTSDPSERFIKRRGADIDSIIDSSVTNNSEISIASPVSDNNKKPKSRPSSVLVEEIEEEIYEKEIEESSFNNLFSDSKNNTNEGSTSEFNLSSSASAIKSRKVNKRYIDPTEHYIKLGLNVLEVRTRDPRGAANDSEIPAFSNSIHEVQIEPAIPTKNESLFVQLSFKDQDTYLSTPTKKCQKLDEDQQPSEDEAFLTSLNSCFLVTGFENSAILFNLCRREFAGFKILASANIPLSLFKDIPDGWFDLIPEEDDEEENPIISIPNSPSSKAKLYGKIHLVTSIESSMVLPPFDIDKQVEIIASRDQINLSNRNQEEIDKIRAISFDISSVSNNESSCHEDEDLDAQALKLTNKFKNFRDQFSSVSDVSAALMGSEHGDSDSRDRDGFKVKKRKINMNSLSGSGSRPNLHDDENQFNSSSSTQRRRRRDQQDKREASINDYNSASSHSKKRIKVPKNRNGQQKTDSDLDDLNMSAHSSSSHGSSKLKKKDRLSSEDPNFEFEKVSSSSSMTKKNTKHSQIQNQSQSNNEDIDEIDNYLNNVSSTAPETITFDNSSTAVGTSNYTLSGFQSPLKFNQNIAVNNNTNDNDDDADDPGDFHPISVLSDSNNSDAPSNSIDFAEVKKGKTVSRDPPKRTHVTNSNKVSDDDMSLDEMMKNLENSD